MQPTSSVAKSNGVYRIQAEINVTPLVDVMLVLLIIFMVTAPMLAAGLHVSLPQAKAAQKLDQKPPVVLTVSKDGRVTVEGQEFGLDTVIDAVQARLGDDKTQAIHLRADKEASYGDVVALMDQLASHGLTRLAVLTGPAAKIDSAPPAPPAPDAAKAAPVAENPAPVTAVPAQAPSPEGARP